MIRKNELTFLTKKINVNNLAEERMAVKIDKEKCVACGVCVDVCPTEALSVEGDYAVCNAELCVDCGACIPECPTEAISE